MNTLIKYGWTNFYQEHHNKNKQTKFCIGRIISIKGFKYWLLTNTGEIEAELSGKLLYGVGQEQIPKVGDWVYFMRYEDTGYIVEVMPRVNELIRKSPGSNTGKQILAANIDYALIVQGLDRDFNIMRLERYIVQILACGIKPVIILNKVDLIEDTEFFIPETGKLKRNCPVYFCSTYNGKGVHEIYQSLEESKTYILIGSSGVGKSSLLNSFTNNYLQEVNSISDATNKGRHTTTTRDLFLLPNGSLVIDTPGMREFGVAFGNEADASELFPVIESLSEKCRFRDCRHINEDGCAVYKAYQEGEIDPAVYESYLKLLKEQKRFEIKVEDKKRLGKQFGKMIKEAKSFRKKYKY